MVSIEYANAYSEVIEILKYIPKEDYTKIPKNKIELFERNCNKKFDFTYDASKSLDEQNISKIAKGIIAILFRDYWATETQRIKIITKQNYDRQILEKQKREKYNPENIFRNKGIKSLYEIKEETALVEIKKEKIHKKIIKFLKKMFHIY